MCKDSITRKTIAPAARGGARRFGGRAARGVLFSALVLALLVPGPSSLMADEATPAPQARHYKTSEAVRGSYTETRTASASFRYIEEADLSYQGSGMVRFVAYTVQMGDTVKANDVVAVLAPEANEAAYESAHLAHRRAQEDLKTGRAEWEKKIAAAQETLASATDGYDRQMQQLSLSKLQLLSAQFGHQQERKIALCKQTLDEAAEKREKVELRAPFAGVVGRTESKRAGDKISQGEALVTVYNPDSETIAVDNSSENFRYQARVTVAAGPMNKRAYLTGQVVSSGNILPPERQTSRALIQLDEPPGDTPLTNLSVSVEVKRIDHVILVPQDAVKQENGKYYVKKLRDGVVQKRFIAYGGGNSKEVWVVDGVAEGDVVILN